MLLDFQLVFTTTIFQEVSALGRQTVVSVRPVKQLLGFFTRRFLFGLNKLYYCEVD